MSLHSESDFAICFGNQGRLLYYKFFTSDYPRNPFSLERPSHIPAIYDHAEHLFYNSCT